LEAPPDDVIGHLHIPSLTSLEESVGRDGTTNFLQVQEEWRGDGGKPTLMGTCAPGVVSLILFTICSTTFTLNTNNAWKASEGSVRGARLQGAGMLQSKDKMQHSSTSFCTRGSRLKACASDTYKRAKQADASNYCRCCRPSDKLGALHLPTIEHLTTESPTPLWCA
jgi:hypothetical protein